MGVVVAFMGALAYVVRVYARLVELGAETPAKNPYVAEMYKLALEGKLYSRSIPYTSKDRRRQTRRLSLDKSYIFYFLIILVLRKLSLHQYI
jgi:hypothetical protein